MSKWRYALIGSYVVFGLSGAWLVIYRHRPMLGIGLFGIGFITICIHMALEHRDQKRETELQAEWLQKARAIADDLSLDTYGIPNIEELARYHDAAGRLAVLAALEALPKGRRFLLEAARSVEPDAEWD